MKTIGLSISLLALVVWGCSSENRNDSAAIQEADFSNTSLSVQSQALQGHNWLLLAYGLSDEDKVELIDNTVYTLEFTESQVSGSLDCNHFSTGYSSGVSQLSFNGIASTEIACPASTSQGYWAQEGFIINALSSAVSYEISDSTLTITASDSSQLIYQEVDVPITNDLTLVGYGWSLKAYGYSDDSSVSVQTTGDTLPLYTLRFDNTGQLSGSLDCNSFFAAYTISNHQLGISSIGSTDMACAGIDEPGYIEQESFILNALSSAVSYNISGSELVITASDSSQLIYQHISE